MIADKYFVSGIIGILALIVIGAFLAGCAKDSVANDILSGAICVAHSPECN